MISEQALKDTPFSLIEFDEDGMKTLQKLWSAHLQGLGDSGKELNVPSSIETLIDHINKGIESLIVPDGL